MKGRRQKILKNSYHQKTGAEHRGYDGVPTSIWITENNEERRCEEGTRPQRGRTIHEILPNR